MSQRGPPATTRPSDRPRCAQPYNKRRRHHHALQQGSSLRQRSLRSEGRCKRTLERRPHRRRRSYFCCVPGRSFRRARYSSRLLPCWLSRHRHLDCFLHSCGWSGNVWSHSVPRPVQATHGRREGKKRAHDLTLSSETVITSTLFYQHVHNLSSWRCLRNEGRSQTEWQAIGLIYTLKAHQYRIEAT